MIEVPRYILDLLEYSEGLCCLQLKDRGQVVAASGPVTPETALAYMHKWAEKLGIDKVEQMSLLAQLDKFTDRILLGVISFVLDIQPVDERRQDECRPGEESQPLN